MIGVIYVEYDCFLEFISYLKEKYISSLEYKHDSGMFINHKVIIVHYFNRSKSRKHARALRIYKFQDSETLGCMYVNVLSMIRHFATIGHGHDRHNSFVKDWIKKIERCIIQ